MNERRPTILITAGTRPEAIKVAPLVRVLRARDFADVRILATAQHREMLDQVFRFFSITPDIDLNIMQPGQSLAELTSRLISAIDRALDAEKPDMVLAQGDTTTVMTTALACFYRKIRFGHIEAGLRTHDRHYPFPEEINRVIVSRLGDLHFSPTSLSRDNLIREGINAENVFITGNTVIDALLWSAARADLPRDYEPTDGRRLVLVTAHRRENFGEPLRNICAAIADLVEARNVEVLYPVHPNPNVVKMTDEMLRGLPGVRLVPPLDYPHFVAAMKASHLILTDSGGVQEEAPSLGKPVLVLRDETERPEGVSGGTSILVGPHRERIVAKALELLDDPALYDRIARTNNPYGDGHASERIADILQSRLCAK